MYVYHVGDYRVAKLRSERVQEDGEWVTMDHYAVLDTTEVSPPMEVSFPRPREEIDDVEVQEILEAVLRQVRQAEAGADSDLEPLPPESPARPPQAHLRLVRDEPETDPDQDGQ
ncbi:hypothetical protein ABT061_15885 [Streptosporangium sp. NPDC002544]|uniref:hypothetical protein n=1 Tax=Streptosporangium sp. NPDC002544 TaxID=3154538 RepID=UPI0033269261